MLIDRAVDVPAEQPLDLRVAADDRREIVGVPRAAGPAPGMVADIERRVVDEEDRIIVTDSNRGRLQVYTTDKDYLDPQFNL